MQLRLWPHPDLKQVCPPVAPNDLEFRNQLEMMKRVMVAGGGIGLAANQVGIIKRMLVAVAHRGDVPVAFVNPKIVKHTGEWRDVREGCLSLPGFYENVKRSKGVSVEYTNVDTGATVVGNFEGLLAQVLQHEIEHLDGKMFIDKLKPAARDQLRAFLRKNRIR